MLNADYLRDVLVRMTAAYVRLDWKDEMSQVMFTPVGDDSFIAVVMPMRM